jgi:hypothetical protein
MICVAQDGMASAMAHSCPTPSNGTYTQVIIRFVAGAGEHQSFFCWTTDALSGKTSSLKIQASATLRKPAYREDTL